MANYLLTRKAGEDLSAIWNYTYEQWSESQADKYFLIITGAFEELASGKLHGRHYEDIHPGVLGFKVGQHIVFYRSGKKGKIEILRILHSRMDLKSRL